MEFWSAPEISRTRRLALPLELAHWILPVFWLRNIFESERVVPSAETANPGGGR